MYPTRIALGGGLAILAACSAGTHVFKGRLFLPDRHCLATTASLDVVNGDPPGDCEPTCLVQPLSDGGRSLYIATMCPPYPFGFDPSGTDPACPSALAALTRQDTCLADGGSTHPATDATTP